MNFREFLLIADSGSLVDSVRCIRLQLATDTIVRRQCLKRKGRKRISFAKLVFKIGIHDHPFLVFLT